MPACTGPADTPSAPVAALVRATLAARPADGHKGSFGSVLVVAGSRAYPGAAILATLGAGRAGAGLVHLAVPEAIASVVIPAVPFAVRVGCPSSPAPADEMLTEVALDALVRAADACGAAVIGPGLGRDPGTEALVVALLETLPIPVVLDADGLNALTARGRECLAARSAPTVLTPHPGEFARLDGGPLPRGETERLARAVALARKLGVTVVLKGHGTVVTDGLRASVESAGNPGMGTGGMGDVLAGALGALLALDCQDPAATAALAVHAHARAGDRVAAELGQAAVLPEDVARALGRALEEAPPPP